MFALCFACIMFCLYNDIFTSVYDAQKMKLAENV